MVTKRKVLIIIGFIVGISILGFLLMMMFINMKPEQVKPVDKEVRRLVKVQEVKYSDIKSEVTAPGRLSSTSNVTLIAEASGKIEKGAVALKTGQNFVKGQLLCSIYSDEAKLSLKATKAGFLSTLANIAPDIKIDYPDNYKAFVAFYQSIELDNPLPNLPSISTKKYKVFLASRNVLSTYYQIKQSEKMIARYEIRAPFSGAISRVMAEVGTYANMGSQIATIIRTDNLEMEVPVESSISDWINVGDKVKIFSTSRKIEASGRVIRKSNFIDENTQSRTIFLKVNKGKESILVGEYLNAEFEGGILKDAIEIPRKAVFNYDEVFVVENERLVKRRVNILKTNDRTLIVNGLDKGAILVNQALLNIEESTLVDTVSK